MKHTRFFLALASLALPLAASAQPDPNNAPKGANPQNRQPRLGRGQMTPEQLKTFMEGMLKRQLTQANVTGETQQNAVVTYVMGEVEAQQKTAGTSRALQTALRTPETTDAQIAGLLNDLNAAASDDKTRHQKALDTLKVAIDVTQFPRLEAMLTLGGLYGDVPVNGAGGGMMGIMMGMMGMGMGMRMGGGAVAGNAGAGAAGALNLGGARGNMANRRGQGQVAPF